jgi:uncharacterized protein (TIGR03000 family)
LRRILFGLSIPAMALGAVLMSSSPSFARPRGGHGGGRGGGWSGGRGWGGGWGGYRGYGRGFYGRGWGGFGLGYGLGYLNGSWGYPGWGYGGWDYDYYPGYAYYDYGTPIYTYPDYGYYQAPSVVYQQPTFDQYSSAYNSQFMQNQPTQEPNTVLLDVRVPPSAQVWFDGTATHETGRTRQFISPPLQPGQEYTYTIRARWMQNGRPVVMTKKVEVAANQHRTVDFLARTQLQPPNASTQPLQPAPKGNQPRINNAPAHPATNTPPAPAPKHTPVP